VTTAPLTASNRVLSIDVVRGLVVLLMLFVNDFPGVAGAPAWLKHIDPPTADGMTLPDFVFPAFLFIVGLSIPFGIEARRERGQSWLGIWRHILIRVGGLLVIGVFMVNGPAREGALLDPNLWRLLSYAGVILVWNDWQCTATRARVLRAMGAAILLLSAIIYRGSGEERSFIELTTQWWGILGLIGWAYLTGCLAYTLGRREPAALMGMVALLYCVCLATWGGMFSDWWLSEWVGFGLIFGSNSALTVSGVVLGRMLLPTSRLETHHSRLVWGTLYGAGLICAAVLLHGLHGLSNLFYYNKIMSTPPGTLLTAGLTTWLWVIAYVLIDMAGKQRWAAWVAPAGNHALFIFILGPILYNLMAWLPAITGGFEIHGWLGSPFYLGLARSLGFMVLVTWLAARLARAGLRLRL
jgi:heparan-alpha-glucosaminide N-acetyltransferase